MLHDEKSFSCPASVASPSAIQGRSQPADFGNIDEFSKPFPQWMAAYKILTSYMIVVTPSSTSSPPKNGFLPKCPPVTPAVFLLMFGKGVAEEHHAHHAPSHLAPQPWRSSLSVRSARLKCWEPRSIRFNWSEVGIATLAGLALGFPTGSFTDLINLRMFCGASNPYCHDETCCSWSLER